MFIGCVVPFLKSYTNTPTLDPKWVECNGQTLSDAESPFNGQIIPNLNGSGGQARRFLRGALTSGGTGGSLSNTHNHNITTTNSQTRLFNTRTIASVNNTTIDTTPSFYEVVYIMKIK
jgi:hypothetical protein